MKSKSRKKLQAHRRLFILIACSGVISFFIICTMYLKKMDGADFPTCRPVWMGPSYARISGFDETHTKFASKYSLYLYREQGLDPLPEGDQDKDFLGGIPLLFIPGNAGSYKQVRSIAAEVSRMYSNEYSKDTHERLNPNARYYDFFAAEFNEDFTAFHGRTLLDQAEYLNEAIKFILNLYQNKENPPKSIVILAHSMGGVVARVMLSLPNYKLDAVNTILTLASPHAAAPLTFDGDLLRIYSATDRFWVKGFDDDAQESKSVNIAHRRLQNTSIVSITGGILDGTLPADYTTLGFLVPPENGFTVYTTGIPDVWTPIDHLAIVWCSQLRTKILRALLEIADLRCPERTYSLETRMRILRKHLLPRPEDYSYQDFEDRVKESKSFFIKVDPKDITEITLGLKFEAIKNEMRHEREHGVKLFNLERRDERTMFSLLTSMGLSEWTNNSDPDQKTSRVTPSLLLCNVKGKEETGVDIYDLTMDAEESTILKCIDISHSTSDTPRSSGDIDSAADSSYGGQLSPFRALRLDSKNTQGYDLIVVIYDTERFPQKDDFIIAQQLPLSATELKVNATMFSLLTGGIDLKLEPSIPLSINMNFPVIRSSILAYKLNFKLQNSAAYLNLFSPFARQWSAEPYETKWHLNIDEKDMIRLSMHGIAPYTPFRLKQVDSSTMNLEIWSNAYSNGQPIEFSMKVDIWGSLRLLVPRFRIALIAACISVVLLAFSFQLKYYYKYEEFPPLHYGLIQLCTPKVLTTTFIILVTATPLSKIYHVQKLLNVIDPVTLMDRNEINLSLNDSFKLNNFYLGLEETYLSLVGPFFFVIGLGLVTATYYLALGIMMFLSNIFALKHRNWSAQKKPESGQVLKESTWRKGRIKAIAIVMLIVSFYTPYQFAYVIATIVQAIQVIRLYLNKGDSMLNFQLTLFILMIWVLPVNIPIIIVLVHNLTVNWKTPFSSHHNLLAILPILLLIERNCLVKDLPKIRGKTYLLIQTATGYFIFYSLMYGVRHTFWIHHIFNFFSCCILFSYYNSPN